MDSNETPSDDIRQLRACIRDLVGLSALSAVWSQYSPRQIADGLADVLLSTLHLDLAYVQLGGPTPLEVARVRTRPLSADQTHAVGMSLELTAPLSGAVLVKSITSPVGGETLRVAVVPLGYAGDIGVVAAGSRRPTFPSEMDRQLLGVAATQAAVALQRTWAAGELARHRQELDDFFDNAAIGLHWVGPDGTILRVNRAELDLLGYTEAEYVGRSIGDFHVDQPVIEDILGRLGRGETLHDYEARMQCKDGSVKDVLIDSNVLWENGKFVHTRCFTRDITDRKRAEEALREADRRKDEFLATLAHELRNPLAPIRTGLQLLRLNSDDGQTRKQTLDRMERQILHLVRLVDDLLEVSRITQGKIELRRERVDVATIVESAVELSRPLIEARNHRLTVALPEGPVYLDADRVRLAQVVANLLNNAAKFTEEGGNIWVSVERAGSDLEVRVRDSGVGMSQEMLPAIFEMFAQMDRSDGGAREGLGIGLSLARSLVQLHGGEIRAESPGPGQGSEFTIRLPVTGDPTPAEAGPSVQADGAASVSGHRVLVVDDNKDAADVIAECLDFLGNETRIAHDGRTALEMIRTYSPHLVLLDIGMPGMDGYEVARRVRSQPELQDVVLVALTGWGQPEARRRAFDEGFDHHLVKPVGLDELEALLAQLSG